MNLFLIDEEPPQEINKTVLYSLVYRPPFWFQNCLNSLWHWLNKLLETRRCAILLEAAVGKQGTLWSQRDGHGRQQCSGKLWCLRNSELGLRGTKWAKKISHTPPIAYLVDTRVHDGYTKFWPCHLNVTAAIKSQHFSRLLLSNFSEPVQTEASVPVVVPSVVFC